MDELPRPIAEFLLTSVGLDRSPAYLEVSADGRLVDWGGHVESYGLAGLERDRPAADQVVVLQGLLPTVGREICLPCVRMGGGAPADLYLFRDQDTDWVLLLDASAFDLRPRSVQQAANERSLNRLLACAVQSTDEMICVTDLDDRFTFVNQSFLEGYGYAEDEVIGRHVSLVVSSPNPADRMTPVLQATRSGGWTGELLNRRKNGSDFPITLSTSQIKDERGQVVGLLGVARDITERKETEEALRDVEERLRQAQKMEAVGRLAGGVAHDFNNLLTVMTGYTEMALAHIDLSDPIYRDIEQVRQACERAAALTRQLLAFSRRQILTPQILDLNDVVGNLGLMLRRLIGEHIHLTITSAPSPARIMADAGQLEQVITNLAVNARDAMPTGGSLVIEVSTADLDDDGASRFGVAASRYVMLTVSDTGHGMDAATLSRVFEPFFTTKPSGQGTGLGLATTYGILRQSGGGIDVESAPGQGSRFTLCLPSVEGGPAPAPPDSVHAPGFVGSESILLVEDDAAVRQVVGAVLRNRGYDVLEAASGEEAIRLVTGHASPIHLMLSDSVMPGMAGRELAEQMATLRPEMKVLLMSGYTDDWVLKCQIRDRDIAFLQKPFSSDALARTVREVLESD
jgi:PAS domain S-box-containing protein